MIGDEEEDGDDAAADDDDDDDVGVRGRLVIVSLVTQHHQHQSRPHHRVGEVMRKNK